MNIDKECYRAKNGCRKYHCTKDDVLFVDDKEDILRVLLCPDHYNKEEKELEPEAFSQFEFEGDGFSVNRLNDRYHKEDYKKKVDKFVLGRVKSAVKKGDIAPEFAFFGRFNVGEIREIDHSIFFCPSDSPDNPTHTDIYCQPMAPEDWNEIRGELIELCKLCPREDYT